MYSVRDIPGRSFDSIESLLQESKEWARGEYPVWHQVSEKVYKAGYLEVTEAGTSYFSRDVPHIYVPSHYKPAQNPPAVFGMYNPSYEEGDAWRLRGKGPAVVGTASFIKGRALRQDYHIEGTVTSTRGGRKVESTVHRRGSARLRITLETGRVGGPELLIEHWVEV